MAADYSSQVERHLFQVSTTKEAYNQSIANRITGFYKKPQLAKDGINIDSQLSSINNETYDPDEVIPLDSLPMTPFRPRLEPSPSPPIDISLSAKVHRSSGDSILVDYLDNGRDPEIARVAARQVLPLDEDSSGGKSSLDRLPEEVARTIPAPQNIAVDTMRPWGALPADIYQSRLERQLRSLNFDFSLALDSTRPTGNSGLDGNHTKSSLRTLQVGKSKTIIQRPHAMLSTSSKFTEHMPELMEASKKNISQHRMYTISDDYTDSGRVRKNRLCSLSSQNAGRRRIRS
ncbi:hypothetical protein BKA56DRAFT_620836 [Ilyonectria sp. MPI-CAGE-AT-0026]|nr:hypothetical protein BKA56DRAFT_620836 [Ilyonectria sp. MPI-CAGE-AT-0026]